MAELSDKHTGERDLLWSNWQAQVKSTSQATPGKSVGGRTPKEVLFYSPRHSQGRCTMS